MVSLRGGMADWLTLLDFGLAQSTESGAVHSASVSQQRPSSVSGTPAYLAPEVALTEPLDARADIYAVGCVAYFLLAGRPPFVSANPVELCWWQVHHAPPDLATVAPQPLPADLVRLVMGCLEKDPAARPQSVRQLRQQLLAVRPMQSWSESEAELWWNQLISGTT